MRVATDRTPRSSHVEDHPLLSTHDGASSRAGVLLPTASPRGRGTANDGAAALPNTATAAARGGAPPPRTARPPPTTRTTAAGNAPRGKRRRGDDEAVFEPFDLMDEVLKDWKLEDAEVSCFTCVVAPRAAVSPFFVLFCLPGQVDSGAPRANRW